MYCIDGMAKKKKGRIQYSVEDVKTAVTKMLNRDLSTAEAASRYEIPERTLNRNYA